MKMWNDTAHIHASQEIADFPSTVRFSLVPKTPFAQFHGGHRTSVTCCKPRNFQTFIPVIVTGNKVITACLRTDRHISRPYLELANPPTHHTLSPPCYFDYECFPGKVFFPSCLLSLSWWRLQNGTRVFFWTSNGDIEYASVVSSSRLPDVSFTIQLYFSGYSQSHRARKSSSWSSRVQIKLRHYRKSIK